MKAKNPEWLSQPLKVFLSEQAINGIVNPFEVKNVFGLTAQQIVEAYQTMGWKPDHKGNFTKTTPNNIEKS